MASGERWQEWVGRAAACPPEWPFGTVVALDGREWVCLDRGRRVVFEAGIPWVDLLTPVPLYPYGLVREARVRLP